MGQSASGLPVKWFETPVTNFLAFAYMLLRCSLHLRKFSRPELRRPARFLNLIHDFGRPLLSVTDLGRPVR